MTPRFKKRFVTASLISVLLLGLGASQLPWIGAMALLHPFRRPAPSGIPAGLEEVTMRGEGVDLKTWRGKAEGIRRGTLIYLHGVADHRGSGAGVMERFRRRGFDVMAYDSRAHGQSGGDVCGYGFFEKQDLRRVMDTLDVGPVILCGSSLGAAVALQHAATDPRVSAVIAAECFSDLRTVATERVPFLLRRTLLGMAFRQAERKGGFLIDEVSPVIAAGSIKVPVLLIHGAEDQDTSPAHSKRLLEALRGPKRLILVKGAAHNESLNGGVWMDIEAWVEEVMAGGHS
jgi:uncharacterized protein